MTEFKFAVGQVVRHRVGGEWRGCVLRQFAPMASFGESGPQYDVRYRLAGDGSPFGNLTLWECELVADAEPPPEAASVPAIRPRGGDGGRLRVAFAEAVAGQRKTAEDVYANGRIAN